jgi:hypothetical protein
MPKLMQRELLRRVIITAESFARNLAYYRVGWEPQFLPLLAGAHNQKSFWRQTNSNFLEIAILEWSKLLGSQIEKHHWRKIISDPDTFESSLLAELSMRLPEYETACAPLLTYRDNFVAHFDYERTMKVPDLSVAKTSVWYFCEHIFQCEAKVDDLIGLTDSISQFDTGYERCQAEARMIYKVYLENVEFA